MRRITAVLSLFVLPVFLSILFMPRAAACPVSPPVPLRGLYLNSEVIVVGKIGAPGKWSISSESSDPNNRYRINGRKISIQVEDVIKGTADRVIQVSESRYQWLGSGGENEQQQERRLPDSDQDDFTSSLSQNKERRLFFLGKNDENEDYAEIYNGRNLTLPQKDLDVYITRLRELANIYNSGTPSKEHIVEWLVSMAENPVTRFEGAFELNNALAQSDYSDKDEDEDKDADAGEAPDESGEQDSDTDKPVINDEAGNLASDGSEGEKVAPGENLLTYSPYESYGDFAKLLTADQKERLVRVALNLRFNYEPVKQSGGDKGDEANEDDEGYIRILNQSDSILLDAVSHLRDRRIADRLLVEIPAVARLDTGEAANIMEKMALYFDDEKLDLLVYKYSNLSWRDGDEIIEDEKLANDQPAENAAANDNRETSAPAEKGGSGGEEIKDGEKIPQPQKTYGQRRAELFAQIYARCDELTAKGKR